MNNPMMNGGMGMGNVGQMRQMNYTLNRLMREYQLCSHDNDVIQIGCNFGLEQENFYKWRVTMVGPKNTPYEGGLFTISITFPEDYPNHGPEFKFQNKIYHLNVDCENDFGHICINSINEWKGTGKVTGRPIYTVKQALFDIFCLFFKQGIDSPYSDEMAAKYRDNPKEFEEEARKWTKLYASMN